MSRKVLLPDNMGRSGIDALAARGDLDVVLYPATITQPALLPHLADAAAIALSATPYGRTELDASPVMEAVARLGVGYDSVDVSALTARRVPLMVTGTANSSAVAEQAVAIMLALAKKNTVMDGIVRRGAGTSASAQRQRNSPARPCWSSVSAGLARARRSAAWRST